MSIAVLLGRIRPEVEAAQGEMLSGLTEEEGATLLALMTKAIESLNHRSRAPAGPRET